MEKIDYKKKLAEYYSVKKNKISIVEVPAMNYLMIDGSGNPNTSQEYKDAIEALYALSYSIKFMIKKGTQQIDYGVMPLEGQWWTDDMNDFSIDNKDIWKWTASIMQPEIVTSEIFEECFEEVAKKKDLASLSKIKLNSFEDGLSAQILHIGPYSAEAPTIERLHDFIQENGYLRTGKHREIYLNDMRRTGEDKLKTIIRQPMGR